MLSLAMVVAGGALLAAAALAGEAKHPGKGGILHVVNDAGGSSTIANPDVPVTVVDYP